MAESRCNARLKFQPILYRCNFNREGGAEATFAVFEIATRRSSKLDDRGRLLIDRLREAVSRAEKRYSQYDRFCRVHSIRSYPSSHVSILGCKGKQRTREQRTFAAFGFRFKTRSFILNSEVER